MVAAGADVDADALAFVGGGGCRTWVLSAMKRSRRVPEGRVAFSFQLRPKSRGEWMGARLGARCGIIRNS